MKTETLLNLGSRDVVVVYEYEPGCRGDYWTPGVRPSIWIAEIILTLKDGKKIDWLEEMDEDEVKELESIILSDEQSKDLPPDWAFEV